MVNLKSKIFFITGKDVASRKATIASLKKKIISLSANKAKLTTICFFAKEIEIKDFQEKISTISFEGEKFVVIKDCQLLAKEAKEYLIKNFSKLCTFNYFFFESDNDLLQFTQNKKITADPFFKLIFKEATCFKTAPSMPECTFDDIVKSLRSHNLSTLLYTMRMLYDKEATQEAKDFLGLRILGYLVGSVSYERNLNLKQHSFQCLLEADRAIKQKGFDSLLVLEYTVTKMLANY